MEQNVAQHAHERRLHRRHLAARRRHRHHEHHARQSITERIREIGVRRAVGAKGRDIFMQIVVESAVIGMIGGLLGLVASAGIMQLLVDDFAEPKMRRSSNSKACSSASASP